MRAVNETFLKSALFGVGIKVVARSDVFASKTVPLGEVCQS
jgi:hypothetical protein